MSLLACAAVLAQIAALAWRGLPGTHDGFYHVGWVEAFNHAFHVEGVYARWYADAFGGVGSPSFVFYPPLFRLLSLPFGLVIESASGLTRAAIATVLILNAVAAASALRGMTRDPTARALGLLLAVLNPYLMVCVWIRGAWPEALAIAMIWALVAGLSKLLRDERRAGFALTTLALAGLFLAHHPAALLALYAGVPIALVLIVRRAREALSLLALALATATMLAAFHLGPAIADQGSIQLTTGHSLSRTQWPQWWVESVPFAHRLAWIWAWSCGVVLAAWIACAMRRWRKPLAWICLVVASLGMLAMLRSTASAYPWLPMLGMIQFPWRWMVLALPAAIVLVAMLASDRRRGGRVVGWLLALAGITSAAPALREVHWDSDAQVRLDQIYRCGREAQDCGHFDAPQALRDRFGELRFLGQHSSHYGPWVDAEGGLWRVDVYDYLPMQVHMLSWERSAAGRRFRLPLSTHASVRMEPADAARILGERRSTHRWVVDLDVRAPVQLTLERLRFPGWDLRVGNEDASYRPVEPDPDSIYYRLRLEPGRHRVKLRQVGTPAERVAEGVSLAAWLAFLIWLVRSARRAPGPARAKETTA